MLCIQTAVAALPPIAMLVASVVLLFSLPARPRGVADPALAFAVWLESAMHIPLSIAVLVAYVVFIFLFPAIRAVLAIAARLESFRALARAVAEWYPTAKARQSIVKKGHSRLGPGSLSTLFISGEGGVSWL